MAGRSLTASITGIKLARLKLEGRNLSQTALGEELGISWSTISKFFNGKPVDRRLFIEVCEALELEWEDVAAFPDTRNPDARNRESIETEKINDREGGDRSRSIPKPDPEPDPEPPLEDPLWLAVQQRSARARAALDPYILPPIQRETILQRCLKQVRFGWSEGKPRVLPIVGAAGYGKSTLLGTLYDSLVRELTEAGTGWVALARCDDLIEAADSFPLELGERLSGDRLSVVNLAQRLTATHGRGVLLLDTLDIVLTRPLVPVLRLLLPQLLDATVTVAFTCRDRDYQDFFEPYHQSFAGFREQVCEPHKVYPFEEAEVKTAARAFVRQSLGTEAQESFANKIIALSADSVSLREIVCHPLLLALLCDLFAASGNVPEDLTVSQLYDRYWQWRVAAVRHSWQSSRIGAIKEKLCLMLAATMYRQSGDRLRDFAYETDISLDETTFAAYSALKSDGVLKDIGNHRIAFFHQTFLEYAIARWLSATAEGEQAKHALQQEVASAGVADTRYYLWSVFRQLLVLVPYAEFCPLATDLDKSEILPFRALAFACVSRSEATAAELLATLLPFAIAGGYGFQETLLVAVNSAPRQHQDTAWEVVVVLLERVGQALLNRANETVAEVLVRTPGDRSQRFAAVLGALQQRPVPHPDQDGASFHHAVGQFLRCYLDRLATTPHNTVEPGILLLLRQHYLSFGSRVRAIVLDLHQTAPDFAQRELLGLAFSQPPSELAKEKPAAAALLQVALPNLLAVGDTCFGDSWYTAIRAPLDRRWVDTATSAIAHHIATDTQLIVTLLSELLLQDLPPDSGDRSHQTIACLRQVVRQGGGEAIATWLLACAPEAILPSHIHALVSLLQALAKNELAKNENGTPSVPACVTAQQLAHLATWAVPLVHQRPVELLRAIDALAQESPAASQVFGQLLTALLPTLPQKQANQIVKRLEAVPAEIEPLLQAIATKEARAALLKLYHRQAEGGNTDALQKAIALCLDPSTEVARAASRSVLAFAEAQQLTDGEPLLAVLRRSPIVVVRCNCLQALTALLRTRWTGVGTILAVFEALNGERTPEVLRVCFQLVSLAAEQCRERREALDLSLVEAMVGAVNRLLDGGDRQALSQAAPAAMSAMGNLLLLENRRLTLAIGDCVRRLLRVVDLARTLDNGFVSSMLRRLAACDGALLARMVREDCIREDGIMPVTSQCALMVAIAHEQGAGSPLLDEVLADERFPDVVKSRVIRERGM